MNKFCPHQSERHNANTGRLRATRLVPSLMLASLVITIFFEASIKKKNTPATASLYSLSFFSLPPSFFFSFLPFLPLFTSFLTFLPLCLILSIIFILSSFIPSLIPFYTPLFIHSVFSILRSFERKELHKTTTTLIFISSCQAIKITKQQCISPA